MHDFRAGQGWLDEVIREVVKRTLEAVMEGEREAFLAEQGAGRMATTGATW